MNQTQDLNGQETWPCIYNQHDFELFMKIIRGHNHLKKEMNPSFLSLPRNVVENMGEGKKQLKKRRIISGMQKSPGQGYYELVTSKNNPPVTSSNQVQLVGR